MGKIEDHYENKQSISKTAQENAALIEFNNDVDFIQKIVGKLMARAAINPPANCMWVDVDGVRFAAWRIAILTRGYIALLSDGRLVSGDCNIGIVFILRHINDINEQALDCNRRIISSIKRGICKNDTLEEFGIKGFERQQEFLYGKTVERTESRNSGFIGIIKKLFG